MLLLVVVVAAAARNGTRDTSVRIALSDVRYMALPKPVRSAEGVAPRHSAGIKDGEARISRRAIRREWWPDCCTRVLRRSIGWRRTAERVPEPRPATKWYAEEKSHHVSFSGSFGGG